MTLPIRKCLDHRGPLSICTTDAVYFITVAAAERGTTTLTDKADVILSAARFYQSAGKWFLFLFLVMPDHIHMLVHVPATLTLADVIGHWKSYLATQQGIRFQENFFDTRIRDREHFAEKWNYICRNPVAKGLVAMPREWPHSVAFDQATGQERPHRSAAAGEGAARPESAPYHDGCACAARPESAPYHDGCADAARPESAPYHDGCADAARPESAPYHDGCADAARPESAPYHDGCAGAARPESAPYHDGCAGAARPESAPYLDATVGGALRAPRNRIQTKAVVGCDCGGPRMSALPCEKESQHD